MSHVHWLLTVELADGKAEAFKELAAEMSAATKDGEPGALVYEWFLGEDGRTVHLYERYADSAATMVHLGNFRTKFAARFMGMCTVKSFLVFGKPDAAVREALAPSGVLHFEQIAGFIREASKTAS